jgi:hypothetical protein
VLDLNINPSSLFFIFFSLVIPFIVLNPNPTQRHSSHYHNYYCWTNFKE